MYKIYDYTEICSKLCTHSYKYLLYYENQNKQILHEIFTIDNAAGSVL